MGSCVQFHYINESLLQINSNYSEISNKLLGSAEPNDYMRGLYFLCAAARRV
jgi:hypothetical protein